MAKYRKINDSWNAYQYGEKIKIVYIKNASRRQKTNEKLFPELEGLPFDISYLTGEVSGLLPLAIHSTIYGGNVIEENYSSEEKPKAKKEKSGENSERLAASLSRTKSKIFELAMCNEFSYFCTFTLSPEKVKDRFDLDNLQKSFSQYIRNLNRGRENKIIYLLIPERHKDGAWHLHGLIEGLQIGEDLREFSLSEYLPYRIRKMLKNGEKVYNWDKYSKKYGFFTATKVKNKQAAASYICKYITKEVAKQGREMGRHLFFASQGLKRREVIIHDSVDAANNYVRCPFLDSEWDFENDYVKIKWIDQNTEFSNKLQSNKTDIEN